MGISKVFIIFSFAILFFCFQQCSEVKFSDEYDLSQTFKEIEPVIAVRTSGCITCHANVSSSYVTDFGFGSSYYLGQDTALSFSSGSAYGDHGNSWSTSRIKGAVIVPKTPRLQT